MSAATPLNDENMKIKEKIFNYLLKKQPAREPHVPHVDQPLKVMVIYESDVLERNDSVKSIRQDLLRRQMDVTMWGYVAKNEVQTLILPQSRILGLKDYNLLGKPKDYVLNDLPELMSIAIGLVSSMLAHTICRTLRSGTARNIPTMPQI